MGKSSIRNQYEIEQRTKVICETIANDLDIGWLKITLKFDPKNDAERVFCETVCDWEYRQATVIWNLCQLASANDNEIEDTFIHEIVHILIAPIWDAFSSAQQDKFAKLNELSTENVARVISHIRNNK